MSAEYTMTVIKSFKSILYLTNYTSKYVYIHTNFNSFPFTPTGDYVRISFLFVFLLQI